MMDTYTTFQIGRGRLMEFVLFILTNLANAKKYLIPTVTGLKYNTEKTSLLAKVV